MILKNHKKMYKFFKKKFKHKNGSLIFLLRNDKRFQTNHQ